MTTSSQLSRGAPAAALLGLLVLLASCTDKRAVPAADKIVAGTQVAPSTITVSEALLQSGRIATTLVERRVPQRELRAPGEVQTAEGDEGIVGSLVAGRIAELKGNIGDRVQKGQHLVTLQSPAVALLRAEAKRAETRLKLARQVLARLSDLEAQGATSQASIDHANADVQTSQADLDAYLTQLAGLGLAAAGDAESPSSVRLRSPIEGVIIERKAVLGGSVSPGDSLFRIVTSEAHAVLVHIPEARAHEVSVGSQVRVKARERDDAADGISCDATVDRVTGVVDEARTVTVRLRLAHPCSLHATGRSLTVTIPLAAAAAGVAELLIPAASVVEIRGRQVVFVQEGNSPVFSTRCLRLGSRVGDQVVVDDGLKEGERVVVHGTVLLKGEVLRLEPIE